MKLEISCVKTEITGKQERYISKKLARLEKYLPRRGRDSVLVVARIKGVKVDKLDRFVCEITMRLPGEMLIASEAADSIYSAADGATEKMKQATTKYKEKNADPKLRQKLINRWRNH